LKVREPRVPLDDASLIARVLTSDDRNAFGELVRRHQSPVRALLRRLTAGDGALADDLAQETFVRAYRALAAYRGEARFDSWLYRIAYNAFATERRHKDPLLETEPPQTAPPMPDMTLRHDLDRALAQIPPAERAALVLTFGRGLSHEEAAEVMNTPLGTLKARVARAKERLRGHLIGWSAEATND
jgi:RNA polymerase sigma factor (sigma-70 family)